jgi:uncharacterized membrane protein YiaA
VQIQGSGGGRPAVHGKQDLAEINVLDDHTNKKEQGDTAEDQTGTQILGTLCWVQFIHDVLILMNGFSSASGPAGPLVLLLIALFLKPT